MRRRPPGSTRTYTLFPDTTPFRSTDDAFHDDAVRRDEERLRHARHAVGDPDAVLRVVDHRPVAAALGEELLRVIGAVVVGDAHHGRVAGFAVRLVEGHQLRVLLYARRAPAGEEVHGHPAAAPVVHVEGPALEGGALDGRRSEEHTSELQSLMRI